MNSSAQEHPAPRKTTRLTIPIILMAWPLAGVILAIILYALTNLFFGATSGSGGEDLFAPANPLQTAINIMLFLFGATSIFLGPISFIIGLVLLIINLNNKK